MNAKKPIPSTDRMDSLDRKILGIISQNARIPFRDVAQQCGVSRAAIHQRVQRMFDDGVITGSGYHVNPRSIGYNTCTYVGLTLEKCTIRWWQSLTRYPRLWRATLLQAVIP